VTSTVYAQAGGHNLTESTHSTMLQWVPCQQCVDSCCRYVNNVNN